MSEKKPFNRTPYVLGAVALIVFSVTVVAVVAAIGNSASSAPSASNVSVAPSSSVPPSSLGDPREIEGYADVMAWRLCSSTLRGDDLEAQLMLVIGLDSQLYEDPFAIRVAAVARRAEHASEIEERVDVAFDLTNTCSEWRRAEAEKFKESITK